MNKITPFLWFDNQAEEAANFYVSIFKNSMITDIRRYGDAGPDDDEGSKRAMEAMFQMKKLDINVLRRAYEGDRVAR